MLPAGETQLLVLILNCVYKGRRWRQVQEARSGFITEDFLTLRDLPKHAYDLVNEQAKRERRTQVRLAPAWRDDCGWGRPASEYDGVHFKTFIGTSVHVLETHAKKRNARLTACPRRATSNDDFSQSQLACDVPDFLRRLRVAVDDLDEDLCNQYLAFYRNARKPGRQCTEQEYRSFLGVFQEILRRIQR